MENKIKIYGAIGYTILKNNNHKILLFADRHDKLKECTGNYIDMDDLLKKSIDSNSDSELLLEEVERTGKMKNLKLMFSDAKHTVDLKDTYIQNQNEIIGIDIRPHIIDFSLSHEIKNKLPEIIKNENTNNKTYSLYDYLKYIDQCFSLSNTLLKNKLKDIYTYDKLNSIQLGKHYLEKKKYYETILNKYKNKIRLPLTDIIDDELIYDITEILDSIMEWYTCAIIYKFSSKNIPLIIHTGLAHSDEIIDLLTMKYSYSVIEDVGITDMKELNEASNDGCLIINKSTIDYFINYKNKY